MRSDGWQSGRGCWGGCGWGGGGGLWTVRDIFREIAGAELDAEVQPWLTVHDVVDGVGAGHLDTLYKACTVRVVGKQRAGEGT